MRFLLLLGSFLASIGVSPVSANPYQGIRYEVSEGRVYEHLSGNLSIAASTASWSTYTITLEGESGVVHAETINVKHLTISTMTTTNVAATSGTFSGSLTAGTLIGDGSNLGGVIQSSATGSYALTSAKASALVADPSDCSLPNVALGVNASGTAACSQPSNVTGTAANITGNLAASQVAAGILGSGVIASSITLASMYGAPTLTGTNFTAIPNAALVTPVIPSSATGTYPHSISGNAATATTATNNVLKAGDTMTGPLTLSGSSLTVTGNAFSVGGSTLVVQSGKVGIGMTPTVALDVVGNFNWGPAAGHRAQMYGDGASLYINSPAYAAPILIDAAGISINAIASGNVSLVNGGGKVGIGTTAPGAKLEVNGNIVSSGTIYAQNGFYGSGANLSGVITSTATGYYGIRVATATYLATAPGACTAGQYISGLTADGTKTCGTPSGAGNAVLAATQTWTGGNTFSGSVTASSFTATGAASFTSATSTTTFSGWVDIGRERVHTDCVAATTCYSGCTTGKIIIGCTGNNNGVAVPYQCYTASSSAGARGDAGCYCATTGGSATISIDAICARIK